MSTLAGDTQAAAPPPRQSLDLALVAGEGPGSLVAIGREGRLIKQTASGSVRVELSAVDETVLALLDLALAQNRNLTVVYPAPAGEVSVLLAGEILIRRFLNREASPSAGIVTFDTTSATRTWNGLAISSVGSRTPICEVFPAFRAGPYGESPLGNRHFRGAMIGRGFDNWPVDVVVVDRLAGPATAETDAPIVRVVADALDPELEGLAQRGELIWGWTEADLALLAGAKPNRPNATPFSIAAERLSAMAAGVSTTIHAVHHSDAEQAVRRLRDDLRTLSDLAGPQPSPGILRGIRVAWHHVSTLTSLPCRPSVFDRFAGLPPIAARATRTFEPEIAAWAKTLPGDLRDVAEVVASDLGDLRAFLEEADPFAQELYDLLSDVSETVVVVRTQTAAHALIDARGGDQDSDHVAGARIVPMGRLHREGTWRRAVVVGTPARWDWHRIDSGLSEDVHVLVLGDLDAYLSRTALEALRRARARWGGNVVRSRTWRELVGTEVPAMPEPPPVPHSIAVVDAHEAAPPTDPFEALQPLLESAPLAVGDEGVEDSVGEERGDGQWSGAVQAVQVTTDAGLFLLPRDRLVDVRTNDEIVECRAAALKPRMIVLIDRRGGRIGLVEAVADRLKKERPDLLAANLLIADLRQTLQRSFQASGMTAVDLYERLRALGFEKTYQAARKYVDEDGPLAPRDFVDLKRLNEALTLNMPERRLQEVFAGVRRWRAFKRAAGRALVAASRAASLAVSEETRVDAETGLSVADLRELVMEAEVLEVRECPEPVPLTELGYLRER